MKNFFLLFILGIVGASVFTANGQKGIKEQEFNDLIVMRRGDSVQCEITSWTQDSYTFRYLNETKDFALDSAEVKTMFISHVKFGYYLPENADAPNRYSMREDHSIAIYSERTDPSFRFSLRGGYSQVFGTLQKENVKGSAGSGYNFGGAAYIVFQNYDNMAAGITFDYRTHSYDRRNNNSIYEKYKTNIVFPAASLMYALGRRSLNKSNLSLEAAAGPAFYTDKFGGRSKRTHTSFGFRGGLGVAIPIAKKLDLDFRISYFWTIIPEDGLQTSGSGQLYETTGTGDIVSSSLNFTIGINFTTSRKVSAYAKP